MSDPDKSGSDRADILVLGGIVVTMDERRAILPDGALALRGDSILAIGPLARRSGNSAPGARARERDRLLREAQAPEGKVKT
jgi:hypothetical protein